MFIPCGSLLITRIKKAEEDTHKMIATEIPDDINYAFDTQF